MQLATRTRSVATQPRTRAPQVAGRPRRLAPVRALQEKLPVDFSTVVGEKLGAWLATPFDLLVFPSRVGAGALVSFPDRIQSVQADWQKLVELVQDPRPVEEKQDVLRKELEDTVLEFLEKGTVVEQDVLQNIKNILPAEAANALTELIPDPPNKVAQAGPVVPVDESDITAATDPTAPPAPAPITVTPTTPVETA